MTLPKLTEQEVDEVETTEKGTGILAIQLDCPSVAHWDLVGTSSYIIRFDFKSETIFGFLNPNYTEQCTFLLL